MNGRTKRGKRRSWLTRQALLSGVLGLLLLAAGLPQAQAQGPDDPLYYDQWGLQKIDAPCAWQRTRGYPAVVAVLDSGADLSHPDLTGQFTQGHDFVDGDNEPWDEHGHGTHVAGIIAAVTNNGQGVAGTADGVRIMPIRVLDADGYGSDQAIADGIRYAADNGAWVINMSLGSVVPSGDAIDLAIDYAVSRNVVVVVAAGNDYLPLPNWAGGLHEHTLVVAATDEDDVKAPFSNSGPWIDLSAPGTHIQSTMPTYAVTMNQEEYGYSMNYDALSGTSMATPFVAAVAAMVYSLHPDWSAEQIGQQLKDTTADISDENPEWQIPFQMLGTGRLDACAATADGAPVVPTASPEPTAIMPLPTEAQPIATAIAPIVTAIAPIATTIAPIVSPYLPTILPGETTPPRGGIGSSSDEAGTLIGILFLIFMGGILLAFFVWNARRRPAPAPVQRRRPPPMPGPSPGARPGIAPPRTPAWGFLRTQRGPHTGQTFSLTTPTVHIGRAGGQEVTLESDPYVSRRHACLWRQGGQVFLRDVGSTHGTWVDGAALSGDRPLRGGERIHLGESELYFQLQG